MNNPMEVIKINNKRYSCGFAQPERLHFDGVRFHTGKIVYMDDDDNVYMVENEKELNKALVDVAIEVKQNE